MRKSIIQEFILPSFIITIFAFLPFFANQNLLLNRNNDLTEFFWPIFYYIKQFILTNHFIPQTNELFFSGTPLLSDPQNPVWYLPNIIFLFLDIDHAIFLSLLTHIFFGTIGSLIVARKLFRWDLGTSIIVTSLYIFSTPLFSFLEAGHWGLVLFWSWLPYLIFSSVKLTKKPNLKILFLFAVSASSIYFSHVLTFLICISVLVLYFLTQKKFKYPFLGLIFTLVLISPALISQVKWQGNTTRHLLLNRPEVFPIWRGKTELIRTIFTFNSETEKAITVGFSVFTISFLSFLKLNRKRKIFIFLIVSSLLLIIANNVSPILLFLMKFDFYILARVTTRVWFLVFLLLLFLIGRWLNNKKGWLQLLCGTLLVCEALLISYSYVNKPISKREDIPSTFYQILKNDPKNFRVLCVTHCIPQKQAAINNIKLVEGYGTLQNLDYYYQIQDALNTSWNNYSLFIPPFDVFLYQQVQPNPKKLLMFNTKYVITKHKLNNKNFIPIAKHNPYILYKNSLWE